MYFNNGNREIGDFKDDKAVSVFAKLNKNDKNDKVETIKY